MGVAGQRRHQRPLARIGIDAGDEEAVDLHIVRPRFVQGAQAGMADAEIVDGDAGPALPVTLHRRIHRDAGGNRAVFRQFQHDAAVAGRRRIASDPGRVGPADQPCIQVQEQLRLAPAGQRAIGGDRLGVQRGFHRRQHAGGLGLVQQFGCGGETGALEPAQQRLVAMATAGPQLDDGLEGIAQGGDRRGPVEFRTDAGPGPRRVPAYAMGVWPIRFRPSGFGGRQHSHRSVRQRRSRMRPALFCNRACLRFHDHTSHGVPRPESNPRIAAPA